jgi:peptide/nickel transport system substrate-binding protein
MKHTSRLMFFLMLVVAVLGILAAPGIAQDTSGGTITWGVKTEATGIDVQTNGQSPSRQLFNFVYEQLVDLDEDLNVVPGLATSWEQIDDTTYRFHLRQGVSFSNGREMTADDVVISFERIIDPELGSYILNTVPLQSVTKVDDYTVEIGIASPFGAFLSAITTEAASIIAGQEYLEGTFDPTVSMLGTGPFVLEEHLPDESWTFVRNPHHWREGLPKADRVVVLIIPEDATMLAALRDGRINIARLESYDALDVLADTPNVESNVQAITHYWTLHLNSVYPDSPFMDPRIRQAINLAVDKQQISDLVFGGHEHIALPAVSTAEPCDISQISLAQHDPDRARALIQEAGAEGLTFTLVGRGPSTPIAEVVQAQLVAVGLNPQIEVWDFAEGIQRIYGGFSADKPGEPVASFGFNSSKSAPIFGYQNWAANWMTGVSTLAANEEYRGLVAQANSLNSGPERTALFQRMCEMIYENASHLPIVTKGHIIAHRTDQVSVRIQPVEAAGGDFLRYASEFTVLNSE